MNINKVNPATLKITDMRFADIDGAPKRCTLMKLYTNQGLVGYLEGRWIYPVDVHAQDYSISGLAMK